LLLSTYEDIKEETAVALLANELLLDKLKKSKDDRQFKEFVDAALIAENSTLIEEVIALKKQAEKEREQRQEKEAEKKRVEEERDELLLDKQDTEHKLVTVSQELESTKSQSAGAFKKMQQSVEEAQNRASASESKLDTLYSAGSVLVALLLAASFVFGAEYWLFSDWQWLMNHPNSYALRTSCYLAVTSFLLGLFKKSWRKLFWWGSAGFVALLVIVVSLLGGPSPTK
jgi:cation transport ATPase